MRWYHYIAYFFGGAFLANTVPHLVNGISGNSFQSPFASPPGVGESSAIVNVAWGFLNLAIGGVLVHFFLRGEMPPPWDALVVALTGGLAISLHLARHFSKVRSAAPHP